MPLFCETEEQLALACDEALARRVQEQRQWAGEQRAQALELADTAGDEVLAAALRSPTAFLEALALVQSRALRIRAPRPVGMRRLLVPGLDISNHAERPSALYFFSPTHGGVVRLCACGKSESAGPSIAWPSGGGRRDRQAAPQVDKQKRRSCGAPPCTGTRRDGSSQARR